MRRILATITLTLSLAACTPLAAQPATSAGPAPTQARAPITTTTDTRVRAYYARTTTTTTVDWPAIIRRQHAEHLWWAEVVKTQRAHAAYLRLLRYAEAVAASRECRGYGCVQGIRVCDTPGLPTCAIVHRESRFDPRARNSRSTAGGLYQELRMWVRWCGLPYSNMAEASVAEQVACTRRIVAKHGLTPWRY